MALTDHEQQAFEQLEQAFYRHEPVFARRVRLRKDLLYTRWALGSSVVGLVTGLGLMLAFCFTTSVAVGVTGFIAMFVSLETLWINKSRAFEAKADEIPPA
jgi:hypothetical protein